MPTPSSDALVVVSGPLAGQTLPLERRELVVGRDSSCDLALTTHAQVSRRHAKLSPTQGGWRVEDLGSTNGTFVDGARVQNGELKHGARLKLGDFEALARVYVEEAPPQPPSLPRPDSSPRVAARPKRKWLLPACVAGLLLVGAGLFVGARRSGDARDRAGDVKIQRSIDIGGIKDADSKTDAAQTGDTSDAGNPVAPDTQAGPNAAPPVSGPEFEAQNGKISPASIARAKSATVLVVRPESGNSVAFGSGWVAGDGRQVITNRHVVTSGNAPEDCILIFEAGTSKERKVNVSASSIQLAQGSDVFADDLAVLRLPPGTDVPAPLPLGRSEDLTEADTTWVFGFPLGIGTLTLGKELPSVSVKPANIERIQRGQVDGSEAAKVLQLGSTVTHGNSGGPVLNARGEVVGVISMGAAEGAGISYAIPMVWVRKLLGN